MSSRIEKIKEFVKEVAEDFNVTPPEIIVSMEQTERKCPESCACYYYPLEQILLREDCLDLDTVLHEFAHHYQYLKAGKDPWKAYSDVERAHCERPHEAEAKAFTRAYYSFYRERWRKIGSER